MQKNTSINGGTVKIRLDTDKLESIQAGILAKYRTQVGILGSKAQSRMVEGALAKGGGHKVTKTPAVLTNAEIGMKHEFGSYSEKIPRRSFLQMPLINHSKEFNKTAKEIWAAFEKAEISLKKAYVDLGIRAEQIIQRAFETAGDGSWPRNSDETMIVKGADRPLIDTGQLRASISSRVVTA